MGKGELHFGVFGFTFSSWLNTAVVGLLVPPARLGATVVSRGGSSLDPVVFY